MIFFFTLLSYRDGIQADVSLRGGTDSIISGKTEMQHHFCRGQLREHEGCSGVSETAADPDAADKGFTQGLALQHHDILMQGEVGLTAHYITNILKVQFNVFM